MKYYQKWSFFNIVKNYNILVKIKSQNMDGELRFISARFSCSTVVLSSYILIGLI